MHIAPFALERYFARYEFSAPYLLSSSDCDGLPMNEVVALADEETRALWEGLALGYTESLGLPLLRQEIAGLYDGMEAEDVITAAPQELILIAMNCLLEAGDHVVCTFPGYQSLYQLALALGCEVTRWQPDEDRDWRFDVEALRAAVRPATRLIVVNFPHNPTGALPDRDTFDEVVAIARGCGAYLFSDEMYRMLELDPTRRLPSACEAYEKALSLSGMSKVYGMAGTRIGWLATPDRDVHRRLAAFKDYTTICSGAPSEVLALIGLRASDRIVAANLKTVRGNLAALTEFLGRHTGLFSWVPPEGGTICLPRLHDADGATAFCRHAVEQTGVMIVPSTVFDYDDAHVRVGLGRADLPTALARLEEHLARR
jgi:aspartate/methionine/tyrosine aminotransferase